MAKRHYLQLAHKFDPDKHGIGGWYASEKLDGMRCFWDGGISRGFLKSLVPWANTSKDTRYLDAPVATGLWSRYGNVIHAPGWFLDKLPRVPLDGELYLPGYRQNLMSACKKLVPMDHEWSDIEMRVFDSPPLETLFASGSINLPGFKKNINNFECLKFLEDKNLDWVRNPGVTWRSSWDKLRAICPEILLPHVQLPMQTGMALEYAESTCDTIVHKGGEGLILRNGDTIYECERSKYLLKMKPTEDAEGKVIGYIAGIGKLRGMFGALILDIGEGKVLELSGFTNDERQLVKVDYLTGRKIVDLRSHEPKYWAKQNPGEKCPDWIEATYFRRGAVVTYKYRGKTKDGIPQEARYHRIKEDGDSG